MLCGNGIIPFPQIPPCRGISFFVFFMFFFSVYIGRHTSWLAVQTAISPTASSSTGCDEPRISTMSSSIPELSAIRCIQETRPALSTETITNWTVEEIDTGEDNQHTGATNPDFDDKTGFYKIPKDAIYLVSVQLIPIGGAALRNEHRTRQRVNYAVKISDSIDDDDYRDVGCRNFGEMIHCRKGTVLSCVRVAGAPARECVRFNVCCLQRKRKREMKVPSKKEIKRRKRAAGRAIRVDRDSSDGESDHSSESDWDHGFESDSTRDELPHSARNVGRLAKRLKTAGHE